MLAMEDFFYSTRTNINLCEELVIILHLRSPKTFTHPGEPCEEYSTVL